MVHLFMQAVQIHNKNSRPRVNTYWEYSFLLSSLPADQIRINSTFAQQFQVSPSLERKKDSC